MKVDKIQLKNFRCFRETCFEFSPHLNLILGPNASGKSTVIEALYFLLQAKQMRGGTLSHLILQGEDKAHISGILEGGRIIRVDLEEGRVRFLWGKEEVSKRFLREKLKALLFQAEDISLISGEPKWRRDFIDKAVVWLFPHYRFLIYEYRKLLHQRNAFLKEGKQIEFKYLEVLEEKMAHLAAKIIRKREEVVLQINPLFKLLSAELGLGDEVRMIYEESQGFEEEELEEYLKRQFKERREKDIERGVTTFGPHLHDINIKKGFLEARFNTSRGEQRLLSLSLHLSLAFLLKKRGEESLILLDDPFSELDEEKSNLLFSKLTQFNQVIFTSLDNTPFSDKHINTIRLSKR